MRPSLSSTAVEGRSCLTPCINSDILHLVSGVEKRFVRSTPEHPFICRDKSVRAATNTQVTVKRRAGRTYLCTIQNQDPVCWRGFVLGREGRSLPTDSRSKSTLTFFVKNPYYCSIGVHRYGEVFKLNPQDIAHASEETGYLKAQFNLIADHYARAPWIKVTLLVLAALLLFIFTLAQIWFPMELLLLAHPWIIFVVIVLSIMLIALQTVFDHELHKRDQLEIERLKKNGVTRAFWPHVLSSERQIQEKKLRNLTEARNSHRRAKQKNPLTHLKNHASPEQQYGHVVEQCFVFWVEMYHAHRELYEGIPPGTPTEMADCKVEVVLARMGQSHVDKIETHLIRAHAGIIVSSLQHEHCSFTRAKAENKCIIVNDIRAEAQKDTEGNYCWDKHLRGEPPDGSVISCPIRHKKPDNSLEIPFVLSVFIPKSEFFLPEPEHEEHYETLMEVFAVQIQIAYLMECLLEKK